MYGWMFNCSEVTRLVSESLDRKLPLYQRLGIKMHLFMCKLCSASKKQMLFLREALKRRSVQLEKEDSPMVMPKQLRDRIHASLSEHS